MTFRRRITLVSAAAVAVAVLLAFVLTYLLTSSQLHHQIDQQLRSRAFAIPRAGVLGFLADHDSAALRERLRHIPASELFRQDRELQRAGIPVLLPPQGSSAKKAEGASGSNIATEVSPFGSPRPNQVRGYQQVVGPGGVILDRSARGVSLPVGARTRSLATKGGRSFFTDAHVQGVHMRILSEPLGHGYAAQYAQPLTDVDNLLSHLRLILALLAVGGVALAALLGRVIAGTAVAPIRRLTQATEHVTATQDLTRRIAPGGEDEIGRLAVSFNAMMDALERSVSALDASVHAQRQLVADASHELRTPVTSLRTNIEILQQSEQMDPGERQRLLADLVAQIEELTLLMNDLIDLARGEEPRSQTEDVRLDIVVGEALTRARRRAPDTDFLLDLQPTLIAGVPARLDRAVNNLLDNAVKYSHPGSPVRVTLVDGELCVRDHGCGISADDLPYIFDRFYRGAEARGRPGSGLGLAIVRQVAMQHGGTITAEPAPDGGTLMRLRLPSAGGVESLPALDPALHLTP